MATYCKSNLHATAFNPSLANHEFEILWVRMKYLNCDFFLGVLYHPPKPVYNTSDLISYLQNVFDEIPEINSPPPVIALAGDFNQIDHGTLLNMGLFSAAYSDTHKGNKLCRIYCTQPLYDNIKTVLSNISTAHTAVLAYDREINIGHMK